MPEPKTLTHEQILELKELAGKAGKGRWEYGGMIGDPGQPLAHFVTVDGQPAIFSEYFAADYSGIGDRFRFIAASREAVPALIEMVEGLTGEVTAARNVIGCAAGQALVEGAEELVSDHIALYARATSAERRAGELEAALKALLDDKSTTYAVRVNRARTALEQS